MVHHSCGGQQGVYCTKDERDGNSRSYWLKYNKYLKTSRAMTYLITRWFILRKKRVIIGVIWRNLQSYFFLYSQCLYENECGSKYYFKKLITFFVTLLLLPLNGGKKLKNVISVKKCIFLQYFHVFCPYYFINSLS